MNRYLGYNESGGFSVEMTARIDFVGCSVRFSLLLLLLLLLLLSLLLLLLLLLVLLLFILLLLALV